jgi:8-oxo-dGTP diphosphatase
MPLSDQGINEKRYQTIPRTLIFLFDHMDRVLLLKGSPEKRLWAELYNGIGGHVEAGEDIQESAERELFEETGISGVKLHLCGQIMVDVVEDTGVAIFVFRGIYMNNNFTASSEGDLAWVLLDELDRTPLVEDLPILLPLVARHESCDPLIIGKYHYGQGGELKIFFQ